VGLPYSINSLNQRHHVLRRHFAAHFAAFEQAIGQVAFVPVQRDNFVFDGVFGYQTVSRSSRAPFPSGYAHLLVSCSGHRPFFQLCQRVQRPLPFRHLRQPVDKRVKRRIFILLRYLSTRLIFVTQALQQCRADGGIPDKPELLRPLAKLGQSRQKGVIFSGHRVHFANPIQQQGLKQPLVGKVIALEQMIAVFGGQPALINIDGFQQDQIEQIKFVFPVLFNCYLDVLFKQAQIAGAAVAQ